MKTQNHLSTTNKYLNIPSKLTTIINRSEVGRPVSLSILGKETNYIGFEGEISMFDPEVEELLVLAERADEYEKKNKIYFDDVRIFISNLNLEKGNYRARYSDLYKLYRFWSALKKPAKRSIFSIVLRYNFREERDKYGVCFFLKRKCPRMW